MKDDIIILRLYLNKIYYLHDTVILKPYPIKNGCVDIIVVRLYPNIQ